MKKLVVKNFWLKVLALFLAVIVWFYILGELRKAAEKEGKVFERILPFRVSSKSVPIKATIVGQLASGYRIRYKDIEIKPDNYVLIGPKNMLRGIFFVTTEAIDVGEYTKPVTKKAGIETIGPGIIADERFFVTVTIPIEKIPKEKPPIEKIELPAQKETPKESPQEEKTQVQE